MFLRYFDSIKRLIEIRIRMINQAFVAEKGKKGCQMKE